MRKTENIEYQKNRNCDKKSFHFTRIEIQNFIYMVSKYFLIMFNKLFIFVK